MGNDPVVAQRVLASPPAWIYEHCRLRIVFVDGRIRDLPPCCDVELVPPVVLFSSRQPGTLCLKAEVELEPSECGKLVVATQALCDGVVFWRAEMSPPTAGTGPVTIGMRLEA